MAVFRCSFDRLAVVRLPDFSIAGYIYGMSNTVITDFELNDVETHVVFAQSGAIYEAQWNQSDLDATTILPNEELEARFEIDSQFGEIHRLNRDCENQWMAITDTHCIAEGKEPVPLPLKIETQLISLLDGTYAAILPHGTFEIRREIQPQLDRGLVGRSVKPLPEARRTVVAPSSDFCLYQTWSRQNIFKASLIADTEPEIFTTSENKRLEWSRLPIFHPDGTAIIAAPAIQSDKPDATLATLRWQGNPTQSDPLPITSIPWSAAVSPDAERLYVGTMQGVAAINWSSRSLQREWSLTGGPFVVMPMSDNSGVFAIGVDHVVHQLRFDAEPIAHGSIIEDGPGTIPAHCDYFADDQLLAISDSSWIRILSLGASHTEIERIPAEASVTAIKFSPDGKRLAIATSNRKIAVWDWRGKHRLIELGTRGTCSCIDFSRDGRWLINTDFNPSLTIR